MDRSKISWVAQEEIISDLEGQVEALKEELSWLQMDYDELEDELKGLKYEQG